MFEGVGTSFTLPILSVTGIPEFDYFFSLVWMMGYIGFTFGLVYKVFARS